MYEYFSTVLYHEYGLAVLIICNELAVKVYFFIDFVTFGEQEIGSKPKVYTTFSTLKYFVIDLGPHSLVVGKVNPAHKFRIELEQHNRR